MALEECARIPWGNFRGGAPRTTTEQGRPSGKKAHSHSPPRGLLWADLSPKTAMFGPPYECSLIWKWGLC